MISESWRRDGELRVKLTRHLHTHPDHARRYPAGHDFVLRGTQDVAAEHQRWHADRSTFVTHLHEQMLKVPGEKGYKSMSERKTLDLKVTVAAGDPDGELSQMLARSPKTRVNLCQLRYGVLSVDVVKIERADGQPFGVEAEFEEYWRDSHCEDADEESSEKTWARDAFLRGAAWRLEQGT